MKDGEYEAVSLVTAHSSKEKSEICIWYTY